MWLLLMHPLLGAWPSAQAGMCPDFLVHRPVINPLSHTSQGKPLSSLINIVDPLRGGTRGPENSLKQLHTNPCTTTPLAFRTMKFWPSPNFKNKASGHAFPLQSLPESFPFLPPGILLLPFPLLISKGLSFATVTCFLSLCSPADSLLLPLELC